jgi:hypothetical protein
MMGRRPNDPAAAAAPRASRRRRRGPALRTGKALIGRDECSLPVCYLLLTDRGTARLCGTLDELAADVARELAAGTTPRYRACTSLTTNRLLTVDEQAHLIDRAGRELERLDRVDGRLGPGVRLARHAGRALEQLLGRRWPR